MAAGQLSKGLQRWDERRSGTRLSQTIVIVCVRLGMSAFLPIFGANPYLTFPVKSETQSRKVL
ncbi:MAG: hypothetical protein H0U45_15195 [Tatlockia sp.]|nr:hypothetical protein [Tatlockia sp.]